MWSFWDSPESVSKFYSYVQIAIIGFGLLTVLATILGYVTSQRINYFQATEKQAMKNKLDETEAKLSPRHLSEQQKEIIEQNLNKFRGTKINIIIFLGEADTFDYSQDFIYSLKNAGWDVQENHAMVLGKTSCWCSINHKRPQQSPNWC